ncbi:peptidoglycan D,D-transpeptidase FtsI family protein [Porcipelethomonas sp.]|uniref:peptidoglycan D,D-transpeptidase FtsI family protein n=1 Tax=Porcipelethomonas sp. TaxID=2981675 RepID=UPI003EF5D96A
MKEILDRLRTAFLAIIVIIAVALGGIRLMTVQIVNGDSYMAESEYTSIYTQTIKATRGQIVDNDGNPIIENKVGFNIIIDDSFFPSDNKEANSILMQTIKILEENDLQWNETLPITDSEPYEFEKDRDSDVEKLKSLIGVNVYATAENCIDKLIDDYEISDKDYNQKEQRILAGIRYEMLLRDFSLGNTFTLCEDVPVEVVTKIKELGVKLKGIDVTEEAIREIAQGDVIPHEIGTVGPIFAEEYEELKEKGYAMNDTVGKSGIELALEDKLKGKDGTKTINVTNGSVVSADVTEEAKGGNTVKLTVDSDYQRDVQEILENFTKYLRESSNDYKDVYCGAIVVLDVKDNAVLAMATSPTYNLNDYKSKYDEILEADNTPLLNRATCGLYRPGSTFKTVTATAGLNEGIVTGNTTYNCTHTMTFYDQTYGCTGYHNDIAVAEALRVSCNIYFYELSRRLGIDKLSEYASMYGFGQHTGIETGDYAGAIANPERFNEIGLDWTVGQVLQAGIGQSEVAVTPLQMAVQASTIANQGVRYEPHLVNSIYDYSMTEKIEDHEPVIAEQINLNYDYVYDYITQGMVLASGNNFPAEYSLSNLGFDVAIKTGTPQNWRNGEELTDSAFIGFAPAYDPQIAFAGIIEGGEYSKYMIRSIIQAYYKNFPENGTANGMDNINFLTPDTTTAVTVTDADGNIVSTPETQTTVDTTSADISENED